MTEQTQARLEKLREAYSRAMNAVSKGDSRGKRLASIMRYVDALTDHIATLTTQPGLREAAEGLLKSLPPIERHADFSRDHASKDGMGHSEFKKDDVTDFATYRRAKQRLTDTLAATPPPAGGERLPTYDEAVERVDEIRSRDYPLGIGASPGAAPDPPAPLPVPRVRIERSSKYCVVTYFSDGQVVRRDFSHETMGTARAEAQRVAAENNDCPIIDLTGDQD